VRLGFQALGISRGDNALVGRNALARKICRATADSGAHKGGQDKENGVHVPFTSLQDRARLLSTWVGSSRAEAPSGVDPSARAHRTPWAQAWRAAKPAGRRRQSSVGSLGPA